MATLAAFVPLIAPQVPGAPSIAMQAAARLGAIEFCDRTLCLQRTLVAVVTVANQQDYTLVQSGEVVAKLLGAKLAGKPLDLLTPAMLDGLDDLTTSETPTGIYLIEPMRARLYPKPLTADVNLVVRGAMRPTRAATTVDDTLLERHGAAIADYAAYWLRAQSDKSYTDPKGAAVPLARFMDAVGREKAAILVSHGRARPRSAVKWC